MLVLNRLPATRIVSTAAVLSGMVWPEDRVVLQTAVDECLIIPPLADSSHIIDHDPYAIVVEDASFAGVWLPAAQAEQIFVRHCEWEVAHRQDSKLPQRPFFTQGAIAGIATKLWLEADRVLFVVPAPYAAEFEERIS